MKSPIKGYKWVLPIVFVALVAVFVVGAPTRGTAGQGPGTVSAVSKQLERLDKGQAETAAGWEIQLPSVLPQGAVMQGIYVVKPPVSSRFDLTRVHVDWTIGEKLLIGFDQAKSSLRIGGGPLTTVAVQGVQGEYLEQSNKDGTVHTKTVAWQKDGMNYIVGVTSLDGSEPSKAVLLQIAESVRR